ncbi:Gag protein [Phytophthora palmivora]|uniref:Gag protein n=1 Tax=Phytophthora palmivora TaxID=4796 RepID=A0A2P4YPY2_9STRA|nr:Gag protein [Phytophthora palmivora]
MRVLAASLVGNPLPEHIKVTVFMDGLKVGPFRTQLFRVHANAIEEAIQIALQEEYSHRQARTPTSVWQGHNASSGAVYVFMVGVWTPHHGGLAPESLGALETRKSSGGLLVVHASMVARNGDKYADALCESKGRGQVSVRLADGTVVNVPGVRMDLALKFEDFDSTESFLVLDMDTYDLILGMPWLEKHEPWIDWRGKSIGASRPAVSDRALRERLVHLALELLVKFLEVCKASCLLNLEELSMKDFLAELKAGEIAEMVLLKPETSPEDLNSSSVMDGGFLTFRALVPTVPNLRFR